MRKAVIAFLLLLLAQAGLACDCHTAKMRAEEAQKSLADAEYAVHAHVVRVEPNGKATLQVLESFKGPSMGSTIEITPKEHQCGKVRFSVGEKIFVISFHEPVTTCSKYAPEAFLLKSFRKASAK
jgi:hypothetical protein